MQVATEEDPSNKLPSPPLQRLSTWMPLSALIHTHARLCHAHTTHTHTTYRHNRAHAPYQRMHTACTCFAAFTKVYTHTCMRTRTLYLLLTDDKGACHHSDSDWCCSNVTATPECVRQK